MEIDFDDSAWQKVSGSKPDEGAAVENSDVYYRTHFSWSGSSRVFISLKSDDGVSIYINGNLYQALGNGWRQPGCSNLDRGEIIVVVSPQEITSFLTLGENLIAVDLWNGSFIPNEYYFWAELLILN
jgi:hypothetical protein